MQPAAAPTTVAATGSGRVARFLVVGALGTLIDVALFLMLRSWAGLAVAPANILAYGAGIVNNYLWHRAWTYRDAPRKAPGVQFAQFAAVSLSALALNTLIVLRLGAFIAAAGAPGAALVGGWVARHRLGDLLAKGGATAAGLGWNFLLNHRWTFAGAGNPRVGAGGPLAGDPLAGE